MPLLFPCMWLVAYAQKREIRQNHMPLLDTRLDQNCTYTPYMAIYLVIFPEGVNGGF
jgi:hypothetical protein